MAAAMVYKQIFGVQKLNGSNFGKISDELPPGPPYRFLDLKNPELEEMSGT